MKDLTQSDADALIATLGQKAREATMVLAEATAERKHAALIGAAEAILALSGTTTSFLTFALATELTLAALSGIALLRKG